MPNKSEACNQARTSPQLGAAARERGSGVGAANTAGKRGRRGSIAGRGRVSEPTRIDGLGAVARDGLAAEGVAERAAEVLDRAPDVLSGRGYDPRALEPVRRRLETGRLPADDLIDLFDRARSIPAVLRHNEALNPGEPAA